MPRYSLFVLKVPLNTNQPTHPPNHRRTVAICTVQNKHFRCCNVSSECDGRYTASAVYVACGSDVSLAVHLRNFFALDGFSAAYAVITV